MTESGYRILDNVFSATECEQLLCELAQTPRGRAGTRHLMSHPAVAAMARDDRLVAIAKSALGSDTALPLSHKVESPGWGPWQ